MTDNKFTAILNEKAKEAGFASWKVCVYEIYADLEKDDIDTLTKIITAAAERYKADEADKVRRAVIELQRSMSLAGQRKEYDSASDMKRILNILQPPTI